MHHHHETNETPHVCPVERAGALESWLRKLVQPPRRIVGKYIKEGDTVIDMGCGPGFFTIPMAKMTGLSGKVIAVDLQEAMLARVRSKASKNGHSQCIEYHKCESDRIGLEAQADFILAYYMVHETPDQKHFFEEVRTMLKDGGKLLVVEPPFHVGKQAFAASVNLAVEAGLKPLAFPKRKGGKSVLLGV
jgi:ubiquinone/menaquinone biosynthesis C-methylase UbiE